MVAEVGADPWAIDQSLHTGRPGEISQLAQAFHDAGRCTTDAGAVFENARRRFEASWNRENGEHPINDSDEVQRLTRLLGQQSSQLPKIGADLENIAAALAEAQKAAGAQIAALERQLQTLDDLIGQAVEREQDHHLAAEARHELNALITACEDDAVDDTRAASKVLRSIRAGYSAGLQNSLENLRTEGFSSATIRGLDADTASQPSGLQIGELADIRRVANQAVVEQMAKVRAAQRALDHALADIYAHGPGSAEGEAAAAGVPKLKAALAHALDELGRLPDYNDIDPAAISTAPDGHFVFSYNVNGRPVQVVGQLKDGTGEFFDQATGTGYTFNAGSLAGMRTSDPGRVEASTEPLWSTITLAVGAPELKAGGAAAWQGLKTLFSREAMQGLGPENVLGRAVAGAQLRAEVAEQNLAHGPLPGLGGHPVPGVQAGPAPVVVEHTPAAASHTAVDPGPGGEPMSVIADGAPPLPIGRGHPDFTLQDPLEYMTPSLRSLSEQHLTGSGETVLGPFQPQSGGPSYIEVAQQHGASYFDMGDAWSLFTPTEQLAANQHLLDMAIVNRDTVKLSVPFDEIRPTTFTAAEIRYLISHGYRQVDDTTFVPAYPGGR
ncbi:MAG: hypothetical protein PHQ28_10685 [Mycobacterium sp.]|nr:hypothetical protein [Mycobacterium sp.]